MNEQIIDLKENNKKILGKRTNNTEVPLIDHMNQVKDKAEMIKGKFYYDRYNGPKRHYSDALLTAAQFHDIGKANPVFQLKVMMTKQDFEDTELMTDVKYKNGIILTNKFRHNEIGAAFMYIWTNVEYEVVKLIYWHHGISKNNQINKTGFSEILKGVDVEQMKNIVRELNPDILLTEPKDSINCPTFYTTNMNIANIALHEDDSDFMTTLSYLISADRMVSGSSINISNVINKQPVTTYTNPYNNDRFADQERIAMDATHVEGGEDKRVTQINAPGGFGKTMVGLLWSLKSDKRLIWVCPRNFITENIYESIKKELKLLNVKYKVSCIIAGEVTRSNYEELGIVNEPNIYESDIVVTNIDSYLRPNYELNNVHASLNILNADVIFDEYHELISKSGGIFALFSKILKARNSYSKHGKTLLLSATPIDFSSRWHVKYGGGSYILPSNDGHYPPIHDKKYKVTVTIDQKIVKINDLTLYVKNTIKSAQELAIYYKHSNLLHHKFQEVDKERIFGEMIRSYGAGGKYKKQHNLPGFIGTHVIQSSLDISFKHMVEDVISPSASMQRFSRCDRAGDYDSVQFGQSEVTFNLNTDKSSETISEILYESDLTILWHGYLRIHHQPQMTIAELYTLYRDFNRVYSSSITNWVSDCYNDSNNNLLAIYPIKYFKQKANKNKNSVPNNIMRSDSNHVAYTCLLDDGSGNYMLPLSQGLYKNSYPQTFKEPGDWRECMVNFIEEQNKLPNSIFDFSKYKNKGNKVLVWTDDNMRKSFRNYDTPYLSVNDVYSPIYGVIRNK